MDLERDPQQGNGARARSAAEQELSDEDVMQLVLEPGFSTAGSRSRNRPAAAWAWTWSPPRSRSSAARCTWRPRLGAARRFAIRLPFTLAISHALVVRTGDEYYALPLPTVEGVVRIRAMKT
jgi:chemosensory pili system protein ChpA (sensor histidine kinase/response regulator)